MTTQKAQAQAAHTPGPWEYSHMRLGVNEHDRRCGFVVNGPDDKQPDLPTRICDLRVPCGMSGYAEGEANAKLIAAAPELLEALERCAAVIGHNSCSDGRTPNGFVVALDRARAALAKAQA